MTTFVGKGQDIARAMDNALLFVSDKAEYLPGVVHVEFSMTDVTFTACDDYATGRDYVGEITPDVPAVRFEITEAEASAIAKEARSARTKNVIIELQDGAVHMDGVQLAVMEDLSPAWDDILPLMEPSAVTEVLPHTVAFNAARFAKFGRVKGAKDAPMDIRFYPTLGPPIALVKVGPTFRGELQGVRRDEALKHMGPDGPDCFWS